MQRNGRQGALGLNRTQPVLNSPATVHVRRTVNINDLENRVTTTEKTNQQVLNELSELKRELQNALGNENGKALFLFFMTVRQTLTELY